MKLSDLWTGEPDGFGEQWLGFLAVLLCTTLYVGFLVVFGWEMLNAN